MSPHTYLQLPGGHHRDAHASTSLVRRQRVAIFIAIALFLWAMSYVFDPPLDAIKNKAWRPHLSDWLVETNKSYTQAAAPTPAPYRQAYLRYANGEKEKIPAKVAYATILTGSGDENDHYFLSTRVLCYQILHAKETKTEFAAPCVVLATPKVPQANIDRLRKDGAIVIPISSIQSTWATTTISTWTDMFSKLHLFELTQYDIVVFMDNDVVLNKRMDDIFEDPAVVVSQTDLATTSKMIPKTITPPSEYLFAGISELKREHHYPPAQATDDYPNYSYLNAGFFVFRPSQEMFAYHMSILETPHSFDASLMEQNLWNHAYRPAGNMPWTHLNSTWNVHYPKHSDVEGGAASVHDKFWWPHNADMSQLLLSWRWRMHGFYERLDAESL